MDSIQFQIWPAGLPSWFGFWSFQGEGYFVYGLFGENVMQESNWLNSVYGLFCGEWNSWITTVFSLCINVVQVKKDSSQLYEIMSAQISNMSTPLILFVVCVSCFWVQDSFFQDGCWAIFIGHYGVQVVNLVFIMATMVSKLNSISCIVNCHLANGGIFFGCYDDNGIGNYDGNWRDDKLHYTFNFLNQVKFFEWYQVCHLLDKKNGHFSHPCTQSTVCYQYQFKVIHE